MRRTGIVLRILSVLFAALALAACEKGPLGGPSDGEPEVPGAQAYAIYFGIRNVSATPGTRADEPDGAFVHPNETADEFIIGPEGNYALLFNADGSLADCSALNLTTTPDGHEHDKDVIYQTRFNSAPEETLRCLVILNCPQELEAELKTPAGLTLDGILERIWQETEDPRKIGFRSVDGQDYFTMTNAVYIDGGQVKSTVEISEANLVKTDEIPKEDLAEEIEKKTVYIHVERMLAKFSLELAGAEDGDIYVPEVHPAANENPNDFLSQNHRINLVTGWTTNDSYEDADGQTSFISNDHAPVVEPREWRAQVVGWGMNALETASYLFKNIEDENYFSGWTWNDPANYRSYWTVDPHYDKDKYYPWQYRRAVNRVLNWYGNTDRNALDPTQEWKNLLKNYPWESKQLQNRPGQVVYTPENTYDPAYPSAALDERRELLAGTHLIVRATLLVNDGNGAYEPLPYLYRDRAGTCYSTAQDCVWGLVRAFNYALASQTRMRYRYYDWNTSTNTPTTLYAVPTVTYDNGATDDTAFKLYYRDEELNYEYIMGTLTEDACRELLAEARIKDGDGKRLLNTADFSIKKRIDPSDPSKDIKLPIYEIYEVGVDEVTEDGETTFKPREQVRREEEIYANDNDIQSLIFEWVGPVDYFVEGMMYYAAPAQIVSEEIYGAVRNAWYRFTVTGINNIGIPVHDTAMPIVPNWENPYDMINVKVNVLDWHQVTGDAAVLPNDPPQIVR